MTVHVPDRFKAANAFWIGLAKIGLTPAAVLSQARLPLTVYDGKNLVTTAQFFALWRAVGEVAGGVSKFRNRTRTCQLTVRCFRVARHCQLAHKKAARSLRKCGVESVQVDVKPM